MCFNFVKISHNLFNETYQHLNISESQPFSTRGTKNIQFVSGGQEVEFHEIKIQLFQEVDKSIMRSKFLIMIRSPDRGIFHEIEIQNKALLGNFDLMIDLLVTSTIMRSKFKKHY